LDETDIRIIRKMQENSRISFHKLAEELDLSVDTVIKHYNKLKKSGKIKPTITLSTEKLGIQAIDFHFISLKTGSDILSVIDRLSKLDGIITIHSAAGNYDILAEATNYDYAKSCEREKKILNMPEVHRLITRIYEVPGNIPYPMCRPWYKPLYMIPPAMLKEIT